MSTQTTNLGLIKPAADENVSRTVINSNWDMIDAAVGARLKITDVVNGLTSTAVDKPLSAYQGKVLQDGKLNKSDVVNDLNSTATDKPLSANKGNVLHKALMVDIRASSGVKWFQDAANGEGYPYQKYYHYEGQDATEYKLPDPYVDIRVAVRSGRGTAIAIKWNNQGTTPNMWVCAYHDSTWGAWREMASKAYVDSKISEETTDKNSNQQWIKTLAAGTYLVTARRPYVGACTYMFICFANYANEFRFYKIGGESTHSITAAMSGGKVVFTVNSANQNYKDFNLHIVRIGNADW